MGAEGSKAAGAGRKPPAGAPGARAAPAAGKQERVVTAAELATHGDAFNAWVAVRGNVYRVHGFLNNHPGGREALLKWAGKDCTEGFERAHSDLKTASIAELIGSPKAFVGTLEPQPAPARNPHVDAAAAPAAPP
ncbi:unnamed protein product [Pedinophyceae sp. YPF-701]|nr:unnamed protein product [Pedinophyceae sp. YPF-701]